ncbi:ubiquilin [Cryptococcus gattii Ru294]|nr:ubiquilin [Cryptococcus gattii Ru294]
MATEQPSSASSDITITVKGPQELKLTISISPDKNVAELKELIASKCDVEKDRQRLIYSGKVLKDEETISSYKIQNGHTIHMVKGAAKPSSSTPAGQASQPPRLPQMGTGLNVGSNPIDNVENIHHGLAGFNPFTGVQGLENLNDPNAMSNMMQSPEFLRSMSDLMSRPEVVDQIIASNPQLASMGPQIRQMMASPFFRQMMSNPETLRMMMQMQSGMGQGGGLGGFGGFNPFAPAAAGANTNTAPNNAGTGPTDPFPNLFAPNAGNANPAAGGAGTAAAADQAQATNAPPPPNPSQPNAGQFPPGLAALLGLGGGMPGAGTSTAGTNPNPFGALNPALFGGAGSLWGAPPVRDERPPEEIYATQLGQLNAMGLWDAQKNIRALRTTGGNVEAAIELIFSGQLDQA